MGSVSKGKWGAKTRQRSLSKGPTVNDFQEQKIILQSRLLNNVNLL